LRIYDSSSDQPILDWQWREPSLRSFTHLVLKRVLGTGGRALDVGCGTGCAAFAPAERGYDVEGIDVDERVTRLAAATR
jgi:2-polyprenyl-3-methyl-5-hydroxy-6-metoxy-1,4-benzoquinol methylase